MWKTGVIWGPFLKNPSQGPSGKTFGPPETLNPKNWEKSPFFSSRELVGRVNWEILGGGIPHFGRGLLKKPPAKNPSHKARVGPQ